MCKRKSSLSFMVKKLTFIIFTLVITATLILIFAEVIITNFYFTKDERGFGPQKIFHSFDNKYLESQELDALCKRLEFTYEPHPMFGYTRSSKPECNKNVNNIGITDNKDFPSARDPNFFSILLLGGSVAANLAESNLLEIQLNQSYKNSKNKPFRVFNGALGGWRQPNQMLMLIRYGDLFDGIIVLDGFNELSNHYFFKNIDTPDDSTFLSISNPNSDKKKLVEILSFYKQTLKNYPFLTNYYTPVHLYKIGLQKLLSPTSDNNKYQYWNMNHPKNYWKSRNDSSIRSVRQYLKYIKSQSHIADLQDSKYAHFIQPIRWIGKDLTDIEKLPQRVINKEDYKLLLAQNNAQSIQAKSLVDIYKQNKEQIYTDHIHVNYEGNKIMSHNIINHLENTWKTIILKKK